MLNSSQVTLFILYTAIGKHYFLADAYKAITYHFKQIAFRPKVLNSQLTDRMRKHLLHARFHSTLFELSMKFVIRGICKTKFQLLSSLYNFEVLVWSYSFLFNRLLINLHDLYSIYYLILTILRFFTFSNSRCKRELDLW